jgi:lactate permease
MHWTHNYNPLGSPVWSTLVAALPILILLGLLASGRVSAHLAALAGLVTAILAAIFVFTPHEAAQAGSGGLRAWAGTILSATGTGAAFGLFPIGWIVLSAIFLYSLTVETGQFEIVKHSVLSLSQDRRVQALLIAFCFGAFIEGAAGFGTPVAICSALMIGAGFKPLHAAGLALIANTSPVAFGALGTPTITLAQVTLPAGMDRAVWELTLSQMAGRQLPFFSLLVPAWLVWTMAGWRGVVGVWPALLVAGGSFALVQFVVANFYGPALVDVAGGLISLVVLALFLKVWKPARIWQFEDEAPVSPTRPASMYSRWQVVHAWVPWMLLSLFVFLWAKPPLEAPGFLKQSRLASFVLESSLRQRLDNFALTIPGTNRQIWGLHVFEVPRAHKTIYQAPPVAPREVKPTPEPVVFKFNWLSATGTGIFVAAVLSAAWMRVSPARFLRVFGRTCYRMRWPLFTIACMLALAYVTRYSGMDATLGLAFTKTGWLYPFFAALLGWLGVALTGSDTASNAMFGGLQKITAEGLVRDGVLPEAVTEIRAVTLLATANSTGGVMGKMIDAQSIVVAAAATQQSGQEGAILRFVFWHSLALAALMGLLVMFQAYVWTSAIP